MIGIRNGRFPLSGGWGGIFLAATAFIAISSSPARVFGQTNGTWTSGTGTWSGTSRWSGGIVAGGTNATATFTTSGGTATLTSNIVLGNYTTLAVGTSPRTRINATTAEEIQFATTTGTAPTVTAAGRAEIAAVITGTQGYTKAGTGDLYIWAPNTYTGVTTISAGRVRLQSSTSGSGLGAAGAGNGTVVQSAGTLMLDGAVTVDAEPLMISGTGNANQGSLRQQSGNGTFGGPITATGSANITANTGATLTLSGLINPNSFQLSIGDGGNHVISGGFVGTSGTVNFGGTGAITLSGSSSFTGTTSVGNATGIVTMTGYMAGLMDFSPGGARTLVGTGTFAGGLSMGQNGTLAPGASDASTDYGTLTASTLNLINGVVTLGILDATTYDRLVMTAGSGGLTLAGADKPQLTLNFANTITSGTLDLFSFTGLSGTFQGVSSTGVYVGTWANSSGRWSLDTVGTLGSISATTTRMSFTEATGDLTFAPLPVNISGTTVTFANGGSVANPLLISTGSAQVATAFLGSTTFSGTVAVGGSVDLSAVAGSTATFTGIISGGGSVAKTDLGTVTLSAANSYIGATNVDAGTLLINGNQAAANGAVTVASGATLGGSGTTGGAVTINGILSPGNSPGVLTAASVVLGASSTSFFEINGTTRGTAYDGVNITTAGGLTYDGALSLSFGNGSAFADNTTFDLFSFTGTPSGNYTSVTSTGFYAGTWTLAAGAWSLTTSEQKLTFTPSTGDLVIAVPEPSTLVLLGGSALAVASRMRLRRRHAAA